MKYVVFVVLPLCLLLGVPIIVQAEGMTDLFRENVGFSEIYDTVVTAGNVEVTENVADKEEDVERAKAVKIAEVLSISIISGVVLSIAVGMSIHNAAHLKLPALKKN